MARDVEPEKNPIFKVALFQKMFLVPFDREKLEESIEFKKNQFAPLCVELKAFQGWKNGRMVSTLAYETKVVEVESSTPHFDHYLLHIFLRMIVCFKHDNTALKI